MLEIGTGDHLVFCFGFFFFLFFLHPVGLTFTIISFHFILSHLIAIKGFVCLWSHVWRRRKPTCLASVPLTLVQPCGRLRTQCCRGGEGAPTPGWWTHCPASHVTLLLWVTPAPAADQTMASRHCQPKAGGSSHHVQTRKGKQPCYCV